MPLIIVFDFIDFLLIILGCVSNNIFVLLLFSFSLLIPSISTRLILLIIWNCVHFFLRGDSKMFCEKIESNSKSFSEYLSDNVTFLIGSNS